HLVEGGGGVRDTQRGLVVAPAVARPVATVGADHRLEQRRGRDRPRAVLTDGVAVTQLIWSRPPQRFEPRRQRGGERAQLAVAVTAVAGGDGRRARPRLDSCIPLEGGRRRCSLAHLGEDDGDFVNELADRLAQDTRAAVAHRRGASRLASHGTTAARNLSGTSSCGACPQSSISTSVYSGRRAANPRAAAPGTRRSRSPCTINVGQRTRVSSARIWRVRYQNNDRAESAYAAAASGKPRRVRASSTSRRRSAGSMRPGSQSVQPSVSSTSRSGPRTRARATRNCEPTIGSIIGARRATTDHWAGFTAGCGSAG